MQQYLDAQYVANTVRMIAPLHPERVATLVEMDADTRSRQDSTVYTAIAFNRRNLTGAVEILRNDYWAVAFARANGSANVPEDIPTSQTQCLWLTGPQDKIMGKLRRVSTSSICLAVLAQASSETHSIPSTASVDIDWTQINDRRVALIKKSVRDGITIDEQRELNHLQAAMKAHIDSQFPRPTVALEALERAVEQAEERKITE